MSAVTLGKGIRVAKNTVVAIVDYEEEQFTEAGKQTRYTAYIYVLNCPVPIAFSTLDIEELNTLIYNAEENLYEPIT